MNRTTILKTRFKALLWMVLGSLLVFSTIVLMNEYGDKLEPEKKEKTANFDVKKQQKPKSIQKPKPKPKPKKAQSSPKAPPPSIGSAIGGVDLGLPEFAMEMGEIGEGVLGDMSNVVMTEDSVDVAPKPADRTPIEYPPKARAKGITGYVIMNLLINSGGNVENVRLLEASPAGVFDEVAVNSVRTWRFEPAMYQGKPVKVWAKQKIRFDLN